MTVSPTLERRLFAVIPPLLVGLLALPFILWQNSWWEWSTALWLLERQAAHVSAHGVPTMFLNSHTGVLDPYYVFYAGFTFSVLAYPAALLGAWPVFAATSAGALIAGYLGIWWTARNLGVSHRLAPLPALVFTTTPYVLTDLYGRGAWAEFVAVNGAAVMLGALTALLFRRGPGGGSGATVAVVGCGAVLAGTHNLTLLLCALVLPIIVAALVPLASVRVPLATLARRLGTAVAATAAGVGLTGAWLVPNLWLGPRTWVAQAATNTPILRDGAALTRWSNVLSPWPAVPRGFQGSIYPQAPVLAMVWTFGALAILGWTQRRAPDRNVVSGAAILVVGTALLVLIVDPRWWLSFPRLLQTIQTPARAITYLAMATAVGIAVALAAPQASAIRRALTASLVAVVAVQAAAGVVVAVGSKAAATLSQAPLLRHAGVRTTSEPPSFSGPAIAAQYQFRVLNDPTGPRPAAAAEVHVGDAAASDVATLGGDARVGDRRSTILVASPLVRLSGDARITGRSRDGTAIVTVTRTDGAGRWAATARSKCTNLLCLDALSGHAPWPLLAGRLLSVLSALALGAAAVLGRRRGRRRPPAVAVHDRPGAPVAARRLRTPTAT